MELRELSFTHFWNGYLQQHRQEEMAAVALVSPPGWEAALSQVLPALFRRVPLRSDLATSCWKAHCRLVWAIHEDDGSRVTLCEHTCCSRRWETAPPLPGVQVHSLRQPTINPASSLCPSSVQVLPVVAPPASARLVLSQHDWERMTDHPFLSLHLPTRLGEEARKGRGAGGDQAHP
jgi:hypothetical protein